MARNQRHEKIVILVRAAGELSVDILSEKLAVSKETIRRDLTILDEQGLIKKLHGGARAELSLYQSGIEGSMAARMQENLSEKQKLCKMASTLFKPGDTLFIDTGSTTIVLAEFLANLPKLTIITNSNTIAQIVSANPHHEVFILGGSYNRDNNENLGLMTIAQIKNFNAHYAVLTVGAISNGTLTDYNLEEAQIARAMIEQSKHKIILADHSKFLKQATYTVSTLKEVDYLITDRKVDAINAGYHTIKTLKLISPQN